MDVYCTVLRLRPGFVRRIDQYFARQLGPTDTRQLLLPVTTIEFAYRYRGLSSIRRWKIDHRSTGSVDEAEANEREESTSSGGGEVIIQMDWFTRSMNA